MNDETTLELLARQVETSGFEWAEDVAFALRELKNRRANDLGSYVVFVPRGMLEHVSAIRVELGLPREPRR